MLAMAGFDVLLVDSLVLLTEDSVCGDNEDNKTDTVFNSMELLTTVGVALAELLATEGSSSLKLSVMVGTGVTLPLFKQLILTGLSRETFSTGQSFVNTASFSQETDTFNQA